MNYLAFIGFAAAAVAAAASGCSGPDKPVVTQKTAGPSKSGVVNGIAPVGNESNSLLGGGISPVPGPGITTNAR